MNRVSFFVAGVAVGSAGVAMGATPPQVLDMPYPSVTTVIPPNTIVRNVPALPPAASLTPGTTSIPGRCVWRYDFDQAGKPILAVDRDCLPKTEEKPR